ncbi:MAG: hypothetical protein HY317_06110 [Acidobacteria bacterium]|nr:hypothetical protein [Acidobacteriota bacterium]
MPDYSPKRRTALVFTGSGTAGAYHAGVLKALDESGVKVDLVVGSGAGAVAAAFAAVAGGPKLYGPGGFWDGLRWASLYRLRPALRVAVLLLGAAFGVFLLPLILALGAGLLFPLLLVADVVVPGLSARLFGGLDAAPALLRQPYLASLAIPVFLLSALALGFVGRLLLRDRRRFAEAFESFLDATPAADRLRAALWEVARGATLSTAPDSEADLGRRYVGLVSENLGQPGFRELILRPADLDAGSALPFVLLGDGPRAAFATARGRGSRSRVEGLPGAVDLRAPAYDALFFDAVVTGLLPPFVAPVRRVAFPRGGLHAGENRRLADGTLAAGCGLSEALAAGAEQILVVTAAPESASPPLRRRGPRALADGILGALERRSVEEDIATAERINRIVETVGHRAEDGRRAWQDPATGRVFRSFGLWVVRPERRVLGPLELDGGRDPASEVLETPADLLERGYRDAYRQFVEPVVGAPPEPPRPQVVESEEGQPVEL